MIRWALAIGAGFLCFLSGGLVAPMLLDFIEERYVRPYQIVAMYGEFVLHAANDEMTGYAVESLMAAHLAENSWYRPPLELARFLDDDEKRGLLIWYLLDESERRMTLPQIALAQDFFSPNQQKDIEQIGELRRKYEEFVDVSSVSD